jgi:hypothetical protein
MHPVRIRQQSARDQRAAGVVLPYFVPDTEEAMAAPINFNLTLAIFTPEGLDRLVLWCRKNAKVRFPNPNDVRRSLDYPATDRERFNVLRHVGLNRTPVNITTPNAYHGSYENLMTRIQAKGVDVEARQRQLREHVCALIIANYPHLRVEAEQYLFNHYEKENPP